MITAFFFFFFFFLPKIVRGFVFCLVVLVLMMKEDDVGERALLVIFIAIISLGDVGLGVAGVAELELVDVDETDRGVDGDGLGVASDAGEGLVEVRLVDELLKGLKVDFTETTLVDAGVGVVQGLGHRNTRREKVLGLDVLAEGDELERVLEELLHDLLGEEASGFLVIEGPDFFDAAVNLGVEVIVQILFGVGGRGGNLSLGDGLVELLLGDAAPAVLRRVDGLTQIQCLCVGSSHSLLFSWFFALG